MDVTPADTPDPARASRDLSLQEAAELYDVSIRTLGYRVRVGEIEAYKTRGPWGDQWRVSPAALEAFGYRVRTPIPANGEVPSKRIQELERELAAARRAAAAERNRAEDADRRLGAALLESGRLQAALAAEVVRRQLAEERAPAEAAYDV